MKPDKELDNILDECLKRLFGGETIEQCLTSYPEHTSELERLLKTALLAGHASAIKPREEFRARARYQFEAALGEAATRKGRPFFARLPGWATVLIIILVLLLAGGGTVVAAGNSMPDSPLYPVKLATEQVRLVLPSSDLHRAEMNAEFVDRRVAEIIYMAKRGNIRQVAALTRRLDNRLIMLAALAQSARSTRQEAGAKSQPAPAITPAPAPALPALGAAKEENKALATPKGQAKLKRTIVAYAAKHPADLREVLEKAPASVRADLARAIAIAVAGYEKALKSLD